MHEIPVILFQRILHRLQNTIYPDEEAIVKIPCMEVEDGQEFIYEFFFRRENAKSGWNYMGVEKKKYL